MSKIVIFGTTQIAELIYFYLANDSDHEVAAFTVDRIYIKQEIFCGLPVVPFEHVENMYPPSSHKMMIAIQFNKMNKTRAEKFSQAEEKGYDLISYVSSKATTWPGLVIGKNCIIGEGSVINPFVKIGNNVIVAGSFIGHHSIIKDHCFLAAHSVVLGGSIIEPYCFIGANSTIRHGLRIARECMIGAGVSINNHTREKEVYVGKSPELLPKTSDEVSRWLAWDIP